jgi:hypothetical protein
MTEKHPLEELSHDRIRYLVTDLYIANCRTGIRAGRIRLRMPAPGQVIFADYSLFQAGLRRFRGNVNLRLSILSDGLLPTRSGSFLLGRADA